VVVRRGYFSIDHARRSYLASMAALFGSSFGEKIVKPWKTGIRAFTAVSRLWWNRRTDLVASSLKSISVIRTGLSIKLRKSYIVYPSMPSFPSTPCRRANPLFQKKSWEGVPPHVTIQS